MAYWLIEKNSDIKILPLSANNVKFKDFCSTFDIFINYLETEEVSLTQSVFQSANKPKAKLYSLYTKNIYFEPNPLSLSLCLSLSLSHSLGIWLIGVLKKN